MLISGPAEWSETLIAAGVKGNLLQDGYNPGLQVSAMPLGLTVAITRYSDTDTTPGFGRGILDQPTDTLVLHEGSSNSDRYRLVAWSRESTETSLLAIASTTEVEIWEVTAESGISATLRGSVDCDHLQGLAWNPRNEVLLAYSRTDILLITTSEPVLSWRVINTDRTSHSWNSCSWSPCGLQVSLTQNHVLHCFGWRNVENLSRSSSVELDAQEYHFNRNTVGIKLDHASEKLYSSRYQSAQSSLQILNRPEDTSIVPRAKPRSHVLLVEFKAQQWSVISILDLPHLTSPDVLVVQGMRVIVGSTLSPHLIVAHLDVSDRVGWTASLSGELELPPTHLCRGIYLAERSPFAEVASTEKRKRATFFHAAANNEPQPIYLSKFKVPRRVGPTYSFKSTSNGQESPARPDKTSRSPEDESGNSGESKDLLELILVKMTAMQTQLNARFDDVDKKLHQLAARVEQLERNGGTNAK
ncbi:hypothetical protein PI124_g14585 [Phytophthora idaei]|nr:hypothetical protein PI124_g14585 [Phytophthora idaei]